MTYKTVLLSQLSIMFLCEIINAKLQLTNKPPFKQLVLLIIVLFSLITVFESSQSTYSLNFEKAASVLNFRTIGIVFLSRVPEYRMSRNTQKLGGQGIRLNVAAERNYSVNFNNFYLRTSWLKI